jgi:hypothetical protein
LPTNGKIENMHGIIMVIIKSLKSQLCDNERIHYALVYLYLMLIANESVTIISN